jgi:protein-S-isoprenylcysteine O-methyltransferase Ste14
MFLFKTGIAALHEAFGSEYEEYKKRTWKLFPGF